VPSHITMLGAINFFVPHCRLAYLAPRVTGTAWPKASPGAVAPMAPAAAKQRDNLNAEPARRDGRWEAQ